jgi:tetratricopeptide (TPR) repeat protein/DNA-binding CsgD family transcriptional regulator
MNSRTAVRNRTMKAQRQELEDALMICKSVRRSDPGKLLEIASITSEKAEHSGHEEILIQALLYCAEASHRLGQHEATRNYLRRVENIPSLPTWPQHMVSFSHTMGLHYLELGEFRTAHNYLNQVLELSDTLADLTYKCNILNSLGLVFGRVGDYDVALHYYFEGLELSKREQVNGAIASILTNIGTAYSLLGHHTLGLDYFEQSLAVRTDRNDTVGIAITLKNIAELYRRRREFHKALEFFDQSLELWRQIGNGKKEANILANIAITYADLGQLPRALAIIQESVSYAEQTQSTLEYAFALSKQGWIYQMLEDYDNGLIALSNSLHLFHTLRMREYEYEIHNRLAKIYEARGEYQKGLEHHKQYIAIKEEVQGVATQRAVAMMEVRRALQEAEKERNQEKARQNASHILKQIEEADGEEKKNLLDEQFENLYQEFICPLRQSFPDLTPTEVRICVLIKLNFSTREIAQTLFTSPLTVKTHRTHIRRKLGIKNGEDLSVVLLTI